MSQIKLSKSEEKVLVTAAGRDGLLTFRASTKDIIRQRAIGKFEAHGLIAASDDGELVLTGEGYRAVGLKPPRRKDTAEASAVRATPTDSVENSRLTKRMLVVSLLSREGGATLPELIEATGWLPHTMRAALSRLRSAGNALAKVKREDGVTAYRVLA